MMQRVTSPGAFRMHTWGVFTTTQHVTSDADILEDDGCIIGFPAGRHVGAFI